MVDVVATSCKMLEIYFEWSQALRHIKDGLASEKKTCRVYIVGVWQVSRATVVGPSSVVE